MDIRSADNPLKFFTEHEVVTIRSLIPKFTMREETAGGYLELFDMVELAAGFRVEPHTHDTHEFYFFLEGEGTIQIEDEAQRVGVNDLVHIPRNARHSFRAGAEPVRGICFSISYQEPFEPGYVPCELEEIVLEEGPSTSTPTAGLARGTT